MEPTGRLTKARRGQYPDGLVPQRGPVQPAVWTDQQPGMRSKRSREAVSERGTQEPAVASSGNRTRNPSGTQSREAIETAERIDRRKDPGEVPQQQAAPQRFRGEKCHVDAGAEK